MKLATLVYKNLRKAIHNATAKICEDIDQPPAAELKEPQPIRRFARLAAIAAAAALLVGAIIVMAIRIPKIQSEKKFISPDSTVSDVNAALSEAVISNQTISCPCRTAVISWVNVTTFHIIKKANADPSNSTLKTFNLTKDEAGRYIDTLCNSTNARKDNICKQILSPVWNMKDSRTYLPAASAFTTPQQLYTEIATRIDTNVYEQSSVYSYLSVINDTNFNYSKGMTELLRTMQNEYLNSDFSASLEDYWNASQEIRGDYNKTYCFGMDVNWETYLETCKPAFCAVDYEISVLNRVLRATGQVGGITTVITLALKFLIWPSLRVALRFPTSKSPAAASSNGN